MSRDFRSVVEHHPLVNQDDPDDFGAGSHSENNTPRGSPETGYIMDTDLTGLRSSYQDPPDPSLSLLEVPTTNWTQPHSGGSSGMDYLPPEQMLLVDCEQPPSGPFQDYEDIKALELQQNGLESLTMFSMYVLAVVTVGSIFQHGFNMAVVDTNLELMGPWLNSTNRNRTGEYLKEDSKTIIFFLLEISPFIGKILGEACVPMFSQRFGRKGGLLVNNIFAFAAAILFGFCKLANSWEMIIAGRFFIGINNGLNAGQIFFKYLFEIIPKRLREKFGFWYQVAVGSFYLLFFQIMGLESILGTSLDWPILLALTGCPAIFQLVTLPICPESPRHLLINKGNHTEAERALLWLRGTSDMNNEMEELRNEAEEQKHVSAVSLREKLTKPAVVIPVILFVLKMAEYFASHAVLGPSGYRMLEVLARLIFGIKMLRKNKRCRMGGEHGHRQPDLSCRIGEITDTVNLI